MNILNLPEHIRILEELLLHQDFSNSPTQLDTLLAQDFREIDPTGREVSREAVVQWLLSKDPGSRWEYADFDTRELAANLVLATYIARQILPEGMTGGGARHCSLWRENAQKNAWELVFHQSTRLSQDH